MLDPFSHKEFLQETTKNTSSIKREICSFVWRINQIGKFLDRKYEFSSPTFSQMSSDSSKWILTVFPEDAYPQGSQVALRIQNVSNDSRCYSVLYTVLLIDKDGKHHEMQTREKVFRFYLDHDECPMASNQMIKEKKLLQNDDSLIICCKLDILVCDNPNIKSIDTMMHGNTNVENFKKIHLQKNANFVAEKEFSPINTYKKLYECESRTNNLSSENYYLRKDNIENFEDERDSVLNNRKQIEVNAHQRSKIITENSQNRKNKNKCYGSPVVLTGESGKSFYNLPGAERDGSVHKAREKSATGSMSKSLEILSNDFSFLYSTKYQYDVTIHTDDGRVRAHKAILAARSDYFRRTLMPGENETHTEGVNTTTMNAVLFYMYSGQKPEMTFDLAMDILTACNTLHLKHLGEMAQEYLKSQANVSNITDIFRKANELKLDDLKISALQFVAKNRDAVAKTPKWNEMIHNDPHSAGEILLTIAAFSK